MSLFESLDEGLKALGHPQLMGATLGGCFSDQKICQECPHRYSKEEPFSVFSIDIRNHSSLTDSLEQYVKGELLEGADAYHCDKCDKKIVTVKRMCVRKLPPVLAIQLKRFEYDYERVCAIKFNDYFEFPRWLDMEPYTGESINHFNSFFYDASCIFKFLDSRSLKEKLRTLMKAKTKRNRQNIN
jgi:ubiquitin carboxyl-terminal hydrolase 9/24